jgi:sterol desaturase/sphingolipid hydroxylase (fatty acid hydroxylase superfamily)
MTGVELLAVFVRDQQYWTLAGIFAVAALTEAWRPERSRVLPRRWRWITNLSLHVLNEWLFRLIVPFGIAFWLLTALGKPHVSAFAPIRAWGGAWAMLAASCVMLDLITYLVHRLEHAIFPLWRLHAVHHADIDVDATTAVRHHPLEVFLSGIALALGVMMLGMPVLALPLYALLALAAQLAQHANVRLPPRCDRALALALMTPALHRAHHAIDPKYYNANFGTILSVWDRCFFTLMPGLPEVNAPGFGVAPFLEARFVQPHWTLLLPFVMRREQPPRRVSGHPI